ncbi:Uma2 family endonuclease [Rhabdobacter roseus]|uniref:Uma2 family endonuclease n=1 Tax=Rhabdobacter roseus TaxID=1655419 RepID=A0A840TGV8_9BACT|nr:Uma2 family endonuclease [Rhabdobacter roseus]MBB5282461.1 Uma2 family endonuclease [Rhabdobacter roseus]
MTFDSLDLTKTYSYADYLQWTFEERLELIRGKIFPMSPAPARRHQRQSAILFNSLFNFLADDPCHVYAAPFDVRLTPRRAERDHKIHTVVQPDVCVICDLDKLDDKGCVGAPDLIVEILSPGNTRKEMKDKFEVYEENGVKEYWLVEPNDKIVLAYVLNEQGRYFGLKPFTEGELLTSVALPGFSMEVSAIFKD